MAELMGACGARATLASELPEAFAGVVADGWVLGPGDSHLLRSLRRGYAPNGLDRFTDVIAFEATVNGRGIPDHDLPRGGPERQVRLLQRSISYACGALSVVPAAFAWPTFGYVSLSLGGLEDDLLTANVTFCTKREDLLPYVGDIDSFKHEALLEISQDDRF